MGITLHNRISTIHQKCMGHASRGYITIPNKIEGGTLYQKTCDPLLLIPRPLRTFGKQPGTTGFTPTMHVWLLPDQDYTHNLSNAKQMSNKTNTYWKNRPGHSLPPDTIKRNNRVDMHCNSRLAVLYLS